MNCYMIKNVFNWCGWCLWWPMCVICSCGSPNQLCHVRMQYVAVVDEQVIQTKFWKMTWFSTVVNPKVKNHYIFYRSLIPEQYDPTFKFLTAELVELWPFKISNWKVMCDLDRSLKVTHLRNLKSPYHGLYLTWVWWKLLDWVKSYKIFSFLGEMWFFLITVSQKPLVGSQPHFTGPRRYIYRFKIHWQHVSN
jgi:hypothetical protein